MILNAQADSVAAATDGTKACQAIERVANLTPLRTKLI